MPHPNSALSPIAIVGMSCRLSGDVSTLDDFWTLLSRSRTGWGTIPTDRFSSDAFYHPNPQKSGCFNQTGGYFMKHDLARFDAPFFQISREEALAMDPQQRQLLECSYEALENAGFPKESIAGTKMGVFVGGTSSDYRMNTLMRDPSQVPMFDATGNHQSIQAARISYYFDLRGPCFSVDTACSSSLYALHSAVQSIRSGEADSAIVAGCSLHLQPDDMISMSMMGIFNDEGRTYAFDHRAKSGFARGEGVGCLVLKPLNQALKDNDRIRSVIVNTATNQDGRTVGLSLPNGEAQEELMREVYSRANIVAEQTGFVEAHGTGTKVGDPIEADAIYRVFGSCRTKRSPLYMGSVKANVGHLENASGIISVIKASLMLERGFILPNVNFEKANDSIPLSKWNIKVPTNIRPWPKDKRFVSVNNFGFGGSNAHAVLERPPVSSATLPQDCRHQGPKLVVLSGNDERAAKRMISQLGVYIEQHPEVFQKRLLVDIAYTLCERRSHLPWRIALTPSSCDELASLLNSTGSIPRLASRTPKIAFVFTGQGAQWARMGMELMDTHLVFSATMEAAGNHIRRLRAGFSMVEELSRSKEDSIIGSAHISQPVCTAIQLGITALLSSWGIKPSAVVGHSSGEIAAAYATGAITLADAMTIAYHRGQVASRMKEKNPNLQGAMLAVGAGPREVRRIIKLTGLKNVAIACENSPESVTAAGDEVSIDNLAAELESRRVFYRKLHVGVAYHSSHMLLVAEEYAAAIEGISPSPGNGVEFYSSLLGSKHHDITSLGPSYWVDNLTQPVLFSSSMQQLYQDVKPDIIVEIGPHSALEGPIKQILKGVGHEAASGTKYFPSLVRNEHATVSILKLAGNLFVNGKSLNFSAVNEVRNDVQGPAMITDFAPYPWSDHKYWFESRSSKQHRLTPFPRNDLLGLLDPNSTDNEPVWRNQLSPDTIPWLRDHRMQSLTTFPLAGYLSMAVEAAAQRACLRGKQKQQLAGFRLREVQASKALILEDSVSVETQVALRPFALGTRAYADEWDEFRIASWAPSRGWLEHCRGLVGVKKITGDDPVGSTRAHSTAEARRDEASADPSGIEVDLGKFYGELEQRGAIYGPAFRLQPRCGLKVVRGEYSTGSVAVPDTASGMPLSYETPFIMPAAFVDLFFQLTFPILGAGSGEMPCLFMPSAVKEVDISNFLPSKPGGQVQVVAHGRSDSIRSAPVDFFIDAWDTARSEPVIRITGFRMTPVDSDSGESKGPRSLCYRVQWEPVKDDIKAKRESRIAMSGRNGHPSINGDYGVVVDSANGHEANGHGTSSVQDHGKEHGGATLSNLENAIVVLVTERDELDPLVSAVLDLFELRTGSRPSLSPLVKIEASAATTYICLAELDTPLLYKMSAETFSSVQNLLLTCSSILWVTTGAYRFAEHPENNIIQGLSRAVRSESGKAAATLDLDPSSKLKHADRAELIIRALTASLHSPLEGGSPNDFEFAEVDGKLETPRIVEDVGMNLAVFRSTRNSTPYLQDFEQPCRRLKAVVGTFGALDSLYWTDEPMLPLTDDEIEIKVSCTGMNFKDVVIAMGQVSSPYIGIECSGTVARVGRSVVSPQVGDRVCAMTLGAYSTYARCPATSAVTIPHGMSFEAAASIPVVYSTAYYGLFEVARMMPGEKVLINAASGGVGQAAIQLAQTIGAEIYATVGSVEKKELLMKMYGVRENHIFYSRHASFGPALREATGGKGVDVVINSLAGELLRESWECLAPFGRFVEIGKRDITTNTRLEMAKFDYNCTFSSVDLTLLASEKPRTTCRILSAVMDLVVRRRITPITPITTVNISDVEAAMRMLQTGKTVGKMVASHAGNQQVKATHQAASSDLLQGEATYLIIGGTGGLGRSIAKRMVERGARHIVLLSRSYKATDELKELIHTSRIAGASIYIKPCDVADEATVASLVSELRQALPPIRGVVHAAMVLKDILFEKMTFADFHSVVQPKTAGAWNLHCALRHAPLDFFILLSSVAGIVGNRGQAAYAAANTFLDALALHRHRHGLPCTALDLTAVRGVGYLAENCEREVQVLKNLSADTVDESEVLALVEAGIRGAFDGGQCITGLAVPEGAALPHYFESDSRFIRLRDAALASSLPSTVETAEMMPIGQRLSSAGSMEEAREIAVIGLREKLGAILMLPTEVVTAQQETTSITAFGLDSLNAIELRNWIGKEMQAHLQVLELLSSGGLQDLAGLVLRKTRIKGLWAAEEGKA